MKKLKLIAIMLFVIIAACTKDKGFQTNSNTNLQTEPLTGEQINQRIDKFFTEKGSFNWIQADDFTLWSAAMRGDSILSIGFGKKPFETLKSSATIDLKKKIVQLLSDNEKGTSLKSQRESLVLYEDPILNYIDVKISNIESIKQIRKIQDIRYIEPAGYNYFAYKNKFKSSSGCTTSQDAVNPDDYRTIDPYCLVSWTYDQHNIPNAWNYSTGAGIGVGLIDTGVSSDQDLLGDNFNEGYSSDRSIEKYGVYVDSFWPWVTKTDGVNDKCGHGTLMAGTIASPRNDRGLPVGVAYNCNLVSYRATKDVVLEGYHEQKGVAKALTELANRDDIRIISMSIGHIISIGSISDAVKYAYSQGKLLIAGAGTSFEWSNWVGVIFPAWMDETIATTGVTDASQMGECAICHKGDKVEFVVIMQRAGDENRKSVVLGYYANTIDYVGGSSVSASTTSGIAALIWAKYPDWTREQVLERMRESASFYPDRSSDYGYGAINASLAVQ